MMTIPEESLFALPGMEDLDPIVIRPTRHHGAIEGAEWVALPYCWGTIEEEYPETFTRDVPTCKAWWEDEANVNKVGIGATPNAAVADLLAKHFGPVYVDDDELSAFESKMNGLPEVVDAARRDAFSLLAANLTSREEEDNSKTFLKVMHDISAERFADDSYDPLIENLVEMATQLMIELADFKHMEPREYLQAVSLLSEQ